MAGEALRMTLKESYLASRFCECERERKPDIALLLNHRGGVRSNSSADCNDRSRCRGAFRIKLVTGFCPVPGEPTVSKTGGSFNQDASPPGQTDLITSTSAQAPR
jgi:hypothetical protein